MEAPFRLPPAPDQPYIGTRVPGIIPVGRPLQPDLELGDPTTTLEKRFYEDFQALKRGDVPLTQMDVWKQLLYFTQQNLALDTVGLAYIPTVIQVGTTPAEIIERSRYPRGYLILNPAEVAGQTSAFTFYASLLRANGFATASTTFAVSTADTVRIFLSITAVAGATETLTVNVQTQDPLSGGFATAQADIFAGANTVGTFYANIGNTGVDRNIRLLATVGAAGGDDITFSISGLAKGTDLTPVGSTIYLGPADVNTTMGYNILPGQEKRFFLLQNVPLFAVTELDTLNLKIFRTQ